MKRRNKKALLSALLALVMCLSLLPFGALAEEGSAEPEVPAAEVPTVEAEVPEADGVTIAAVTITGVTAPVAGQEASFAWSLPTGANYLMDDSDGSGGSAWIVSDTAPADWDDLSYDEWYFASGWGREEDDKLVFEAGKYYTFMAYLKSGEGATFASGVPATINGNTASTQEYTTHLKLVIWYTFALPAEGGSPTPTEIDSIAITGVTAPVVGEKVSFACSLPSGANYQLYNPNPEIGERLWVANATEPQSVQDILDEGKPVGSDMAAADYLSFRSGVWYSFGLYVEAKEGYVFADEVTATINDKTAEVQVVEEGSQLLLLYYFGAPTDNTPPTEIDSIAITGVTAPVDGRTMNFDWSLPADSGLYPYDDTVASLYKDCCWIVADKSYDKLTDIWLNGERIYESSYDGAPFEAGSYVTFLAYVGAESGYVFADSVTASINGTAAHCNKVTDGTVSPNVTYYEVWYTFGPLADTSEKIDSVAIAGVTAPVAGQTARFDWTDPAADAGYVKRSGSGCWIEMDTADQAYDDAELYFENETLVFSADKYYAFTAWIQADAGCSFADTVSATMNGETAEFETSESPGMEAVTYRFGRPAEGGTTAPMEIKITGVTEPELGEQADYSFHALSGVAYYIPSDSIAWVESSSKPQSFESLVRNGDFYSRGEELTFQAGKYYSFLVAVVHPDGFPEVLTATVNGEVARQYRADENQVYVWYTFEPRKAHSVDRVDVYDVVEPAVGEKASFNWEVASGTDYKKSDDPVNCAWLVTDSKPADIDALYAATDWHYATDSEPLEFETGKYYSFLCFVEAKDGGRFERGAYGTMNGVPANTADYPDEGYQYLDVWYTFGPLSDTVPQPVEIDEVDILDVTAPVAGAKASFVFSIPADAPYRVITDDGITCAAWVETTAPITTAEELQAAMMNDAGVYYDYESFDFQAGKYYTFVARTTPKAGNRFAEEVSGTMNGAAAGTDALDEQEVDVFYCFGPTEAAGEIDTITITNVTTPVAGRDFEYGFDVPAGAAYKAFVDNFGDAAAWVESDTIPTTLAELRHDGDWYFLADGGDYEFEEGYYYSFVAQVTPVSGWTFSDSATATINGKEAHVDVYVDFWNDAGGTNAERFIWYTFFSGEELEGEEITKLEVLNVTKPVAGEEAAFGWNVPGDANYSKDVDSDGDDGAWVVTDTEPQSWGDVNTGEWYFFSGYGRDDDDTIVFEEGKYYTFVAWLKPNSDYVFGLDARAYMNGEKAGLDFDRGSASVYQTFTVEKDGGGDTGGDNKPVKPPEVPETGDSGRPGLWLALTMLAAGGLMGLGFRRKKAKN